MNQNKLPKYLIYYALIIFVLIFVSSLITSGVIKAINATEIQTVIILLFSAIIVSLIIATGFVLFLPTIADKISSLRRMIRIESLSNPLILKLSSRAPGTYHHSLNVSTLAQKAAKSIGADSLLVRTAAYYHDIGKIENPQLFIENQIVSGRIVKKTSLDSIKKDASPIISHVEKGIEIAKKHNLPQEIIDLIKEHHGTTYTRYFYRIAEETGSEVEKKDFQYEGPIPQSKESMILMLSDCVEATARATNDLTVSEIKDIVLRTIKDKINENQFNNCGLNENEISKIKTSLEETLRSIFHQRIQYKK